MRRASAWGPRSGVASRPRRATLLRRLPLALLARAPGLGPQLQPPGPAPRPCSA